MRRFNRTLVAAALTTTVVAGTAGWVSGNSQTPVTGPPPGAAAWVADGSLGRRLPDPAAAGPGEVARFFSGLTHRQQQVLAARHALVVGNLDGAPVALRYEANARTLRAERHSTDPRTRERAARLLAGGRQILAYDPRGRGQVAEVYGDLERSAHVAVIVPGSDIDAGSFDRAKDAYGTPAGMARALRSTAGGRTAVVAWAGYTTPVGVGVDAATGRLAEAGAERLTRFTRGLIATGAARPAVFCHSYGAVVCGLAAPGLNASDLVVFGSPGMRADNVADLHTGARVWAAKDPSDWISKVPNVELLGLGHGNDPADPAFGARTVPSDDAEGHTGYFAPGTSSLRTFAAIARGEAR